MLEGLHDIDWASMRHAYGPAEEVPAILIGLCSADEKEREGALDDYYGAVHHQGDIYPCTVATLPFLFALAADPATPDRAAIIGLLVNIGEVAIEWHRGDHETTPEIREAAAAMRERSAMFVGFAAHEDFGIREAAIPALGLFVDDARSALRLLRERLEAEQDAEVLMSVLHTMSTLALRLPAAAEEAAARFTEVTADRSFGPAVRFAALTEHVRGALDEIGDGIVPAAVALLDELSPRSEPSDGQSPPETVAAFEGRRGHSPVSRPLASLHHSLGERTGERAELLTAQLRSPDPRLRFDGIRDTGDFVRSWRGDHSALIALLAEQLASGDALAAAAAETLARSHPIAEPAREALAAFVDGRRQIHGAEAWHAADPDRRTAYRESVRALARLGDTRAVPALLDAIDTGQDTRTAVQASRFLPQAADRLAPRVCEYLRGIDLAGPHPNSEANPALFALGALGDPAALPTIAEVLTAAIRLEQWPVVRSALASSRRFGAAAPDALDDIRPLTSAPDQGVVQGAIEVIWTRTGDPAEVLPRLATLLDSDDSFTMIGAADVLAEIGPAAASSLPRLRTLLSHRYEWVRVHAAAAMWAIGGENETDVVLDVLCRAWEQNLATGNHVTECLDRMGTAAGPAVPMVRAELALARRSGRFGGIEHDEALQRTCRAIARRFG